MLSVKPVALNPALSITVHDPIPQKSRTLLGGILGAPILGDLPGSFMFSSEIVTAGPCGFVLKTIPIESFQMVNLT